LLLTADLAQPAGEMNITVLHSNNNSQ